MPGTRTVDEKVTDNQGKYKFLRAQSELHNVIFSTAKLVPRQIFSMSRLAIVIPQAYINEYFLLLESTIKKLGPPITIFSDKTIFSQLGFLSR